MRPEGGTYVVGFIDEAKCYFKNLKHSLNVMFSVNWSILSFTLEILSTLYRTYTCILILLLTVK